MAVEIKDQKKQDELSIPFGQQVGGPSLGAAGQPQGAPTGSSRFAGLQKYLQANVPAGQTMAGTIQAKAGGEVSKLEKEATQRASDVRAGIQAGKEALGTGRELESQIRGPGFKASELAESPQFQKLQQLQAGGGVSEEALRSRLGESQIAQQRALQSALGLGKALGTETGRFGLLKQAYGIPSSQLGALDVALLSKGGGEQMRELQRDIGARTRALTPGGLDSQRLQREVEGLGQEEQELMRGISGALTGQQQSLEEQVRQSGIGELARQKAEYERLGRGDFTQEDIEKYLKLQSPSGIAGPARTYGLSAQELGKLIKTPTEVLPSEITAQQIATPEQRAQAAALSKLMGTEQTYLTGAPQEIKFDPFGEMVKSAVAGKKGEYESEFKKLYEQQAGQKTGLAGHQQALAVERANQLKSEFEEKYGKPGTNVFGLPDISEQRKTLLSQFLGEKLQGGRDTSAERQEIFSLFPELEAASEGPSLGGGGGEGVRQMARDYQTALAQLQKRQLDESKSLENRYGGTAASLVRR